MVIYDGKNSMIFSGIVKMYRSQNGCHLSLKMFESIERTMCSRQRFKYIMYMYEKRVFMLQEMWYILNVFLG